MIKGRWKGGSKLAVAIAAASLVLPASIVIAAPAAKSGKRPPALSFSFDRSFTPAQADPRLAAALASRPSLASEFRFTPAASKNRPSQVRVAIRAQTANRTQAAVRARQLAVQPTSAGVDLTPTSYNLGVAVGWKRFAVSGDVAKAKSANPALAGREGAVVGVSYDLKKFTGRVAASADRPTGRSAPAITDSNSYALDVGGAYKLSNKVAVTGGYRYKIEREKVATLNDQRRDSQAVFIGTAVKF